MSRKYVKVAKTKDLADHPLKKIEIEGRNIALARLGDRYHAFDHRCKHRGGPLAMGELSDGTITCPWHGGVFDIRTGDLMHPPPVERLRTYPVRIVGEDIEVEYESSEGD